MKEYSGNCHCGEVKYKFFSEELVDPRLAEVIAEEANAQVILFSPLEALTPDEIGTNISYIDKMEQNLDSLVVALECQ